ncbi:putative metallopeptidase [Clostridium kluyveri]|uniref:putative metallopeptidase n=1 Tax=Clostridium kluyveri TaxID=1534 RepID=UPI0022479775|nr:putative metallopeptidase [Clostridium kluyveri]UZQ49831.1 putative metallopeptidase [Clostridium kluyveri]
MPRIKIIDDRTGNVKEIECSGFNLQYVQSTGNGVIQKIRELNNGRYDSRHWIKNEFYAPLAQKIKDKFKETVPEFTSININKILFIEDTDYMGDELKRDDDVMWIKKAPKQLTILTGYEFIIESREFWTERISKEQIIALIYSCLKQIDGDKLRTPDVKGWKEIIGTMGYGWETTMSPIPNILEGFDDSDFSMLKKADRQVSIFDKAN